MKKTLATTVVGFTALLLSGCLEFVKAPFSENDFVSMESTTVGRDMMKVLSQARSTNAQVNEMLNDLGDSVDAVVVDDMFIIQENNSGKWWIYALSMSDTHIFSCIPMDLDDYDFPATVSVDVREEMVNIHTVDGPQPILRQIAIDVVRNAQKVCISIPIPKESNEEGLTSNEFILKIVGTYEGEVTWDGGSEGEMTWDAGSSPYTTTIILEGNSLRGTAADPDGPRDTFTLIKAFPETREIIIKWEEGGNVGQALFRFSPDYSSFEGTWGEGSDYEGGGTWNGVAP